MSLHIFASARDRQEETHVNKFAFFVQLQFSPIFTNFAPFSSISANSLKEQTIFTNFLKESISFHHLSSLFTTSRQFSANFCQFLAIFINFGQFLAISTNFSQQAPFGTASQSSAARVRGSVEMLRTCEVHSSKPSSNETLCQRAGRLTDENMWQF